MLFALLTADFQSYITSLTMCDMATFCKKLIPKTNDENIKISQGDSAGLQNVEI